MLYHLFVPLSQDLVFLNIFRYLTFRGTGAMLTALVLTIFFGPMFIRMLQRLKCGQAIHEDVKTHQAKAGTPTMGGLLMCFSVTITIFLWGNLSNLYLLLTLFVFLGFAFVGFADDYTKIKGKHNKGITPRQKMTGLLFVGTVALVALLSFTQYPTQLSIPFFKNFIPDISWLYLPFGLLVLVSTANAVNITDGLDGLAITPSVIVLGVYSIFIYVAGNAAFSKYLQLLAVPQVGEVFIFSAALMGAGLGFLWFNAYPAQVFMGDVGSLSIGGAIGFIAILAKQEFTLIIAGGVFVLEILSVIMQVGYFKYSKGKRIFRMAPLHHHYELKGVPESKIIIRFWILSILFALLALSVLKLR